MIKIDKNYYITNDSNQWTLHYEKVGDINPKTGKNTITKNSWYCGTLERCLKRYIDESLKPAENVIKMAEMLRKAYGNVKELILKHET